MSDIYGLLISHAPLLALGATGLLACGCVCLALTHSPVHRQRIGELTLLADSDPDFGRVSVQFMFGGLSLASEQTWRDWRVARAVELWEACFLSLYLNPDGVDPRQLDGKGSPRGLTIGSMVRDRIMQASQHAKRGSLPCIRLMNSVRISAPPQLAARRLALSKSRLNNKLHNATSAGGASTGFPPSVSKQ